MNNTYLLQECLKDFKEENELSSVKNDELFEIFSSLQITKDSETSFSEIESSVVDGGLDGGIDTFLILVNDKNIDTDHQLNDIKFNEKTDVKIYVSQAKTEKSFKEGTLDKLYISLPLIFEFNKKEKSLLERFNESLVERVMIFRKVWINSVKKNSNLTITFTYSTLADQIVMNDAFRSKVKQIIDITKEKIPLANVHFEPYSAKELLDLYGKRKSEELELRFKENPIPVPFNESEYGYIGVVSLKDFYNFIVDEKGNIRESIFESNIRHYQGSVDVNKRIEDTLKNDYSRDFWWLNNGITIITSKCNPIPKVLVLENVQIVNGLQSSYTISKYYNPSENDDRSVLVKVIISDDKETVDKIISSSNSQNYIPPASLRATDDIQRKLETYFLSKGFYYDRRKNYYKNKNKPANKIFSIQYAAQAIEAVLNFNPAVARSKPTSLVKNGKSYEQIFDESRSLEAYLKCCILYQKVAEFIRYAILSDEKSKAKTFSYHIVRVLASILTNKTSYDWRDIEAIDVDTIENEKVYEAYNFVVNIVLRKYWLDNSKENIINISKSRKFTHEIEKEMASKNQVIYGNIGGLDAVAVTIEEKYIINKQGAKVYLDVSTQPDLDIPEADGFEVRGVFHQVLSAGLVQDTPIITVMFEEIPTAYKIPKELRGWVEYLLNSSMIGINLLPCEVEFGYNNAEKRFFAEML